MDILSKLPFLKSEPEEGQTPTEAEAKAERIAFHRAHVRNGPSNFKTQTNGQARRAGRRALDRRTKTARRKQIRNYFETQRLAAATRGHLQAAGILPYVNVSFTNIDRVAQVHSAVWLVQHFSDGPTSFQHSDVLTALGAALKFYGQSIGDETLQVPADYVVPIYEVEGGTVLANETQVLGS